MSEKEEAKKEIRATVTVKTAQAIAKYAEKNELSVGEAIDKMINTCVSRLAALARYAKNTKEGKPAGKPRAKKAAKPKAKKAAAKPRAKKAAEASQANGAAQATA